MENKQSIGGIVSRIVEGAKAAFAPQIQEKVNEEFNSGPLAPGTPINPVWHNNDGEQLDARRFDYAVGWNMNVRPRGESTRTRPHVYSADELRWLSRAYGLLRIAIETRKNQVLGQNWTLKSRNKEATPEGTVRFRDAMKLMNKPDGRHLFQDWQKTILEDMLVLDQVCVRVDTTIGGQPLAFRPIDAGTIKLVLDMNGERPEAPLPSYMQIIAGVPSSWYDTNEMIFRVYNPATDWPYGYSPVEQIADIVSLGLRRQQHQLNYYTEGNLPESIIMGPAGWTETQVGLFQKYWDEHYEGENALKGRRRTRFMPNGATLVQAKDAILKDEMDDWLAREICYAFNISPSALTKDNNRAVGETIYEQNLREGLVPLLNWLKALYDDILDRAGYSDFEFSWMEENSLDPLEQAQVNQIYASMGAKTIDEVRADIGLPPLPNGEGTVASKPAPAVDMSSGGSAADFLSMFGVTKRHGYGRKDVHNHGHSHGHAKIAKAQKKSV